MTKSKSDEEVEFLQWALPRLKYCWTGFRKPRGQVIKRIRQRIRELDLMDTRTYRTYLQTHPEEWPILDLMCDVTISRFFRDRELWNYLKVDLLPEMLKNREYDHIRIWSIGCCNGEEPYSMAIIAEEVQETTSDPIEISILATDRNPHALCRARTGRYPGGALKEVSAGIKKKYFRPDPDHTNHYLIADAVKARVRIEDRDITETLPEEVFDLIFCRNLVYTYFSIERQVEFTEKVATLLRSGGFLIHGAHENLPATEHFIPENRSLGVYRKK